MRLPDTTPAPVAHALKQLTDESAGIADVSGLILYGSLARGEFRQEESDVNVIVSLDEGRHETLRALHQPLRTAWRSVRVEPFIVREKEVPRIADVFPIKLLDIRQHHLVLSGSDPFTGVTIERVDVRRRAEQELRNHALRLRRHYVFHHASPDLLARAVYRSATALRHELGALLYLEGEMVSWRLSEVLPAAAQRFGLAADALSRIERFHEGSDDADLTGLFAGLVDVVDAAVAIVDQMEAS